MAKLIVRSPEGEQTVTLTPGRLTMGRSPDSGLVLRQQPTSRHHAELDVRADGVYITDVGSTAGTSVDGVQLLANQPRLLRSGEVIQIGPYALLYLAEEVAPAAQPEDEPQPAEPAPAPAAADAESANVTGVIAIAAPAAPADEPEQDLLPTRQDERYLLSTSGLDSRYLRFLPMIFQENDFLGRYLKIFETIWEPFEWRVDHIHMYFDPRTCPPGMLPWLAGWLDLSINAHWPAARQRRLLAEATDLYRWRGTRYGLTRLIEVCTGITPEISEDPASPFTFTVKMRLPRDGDVDRYLVEEIVREHKPAHAGYTLELSEGEAA